MERLRALIAQRIGHRQRRVSAMAMNPAGRMTWLAGPVGAGALRWPFNRWQTRALLIVLTVLAVCVILMIWPFLGARGPAAVVYWLHDALVLPIRGRVFERYAPVPQILIVLLIALACAGLFLRGIVGRIHAVATDVVLAQPKGAALLRKWAAWRGEDSFLLLQAERRHRVAVADWLVTQDDPQARERALEVGERAYGLILASAPGGVSGARDIALAQIIARNAIVRGAVERAPPLAEGGDGRMTGLARSALSHTADRATFERAFEAAWRATARGNALQKAVGTEALCWIAAAYAQRVGDAYLLHACLGRRSRMAFEQDLNRPLQGTDGARDDILFDPLLTRFIDADPAQEPNADLEGLRVALAVGRNNEARR